MHEILVVVVSAVCGGASGWLTALLKYRHVRQLRQDDSAVASHREVVRALADLRAAYLRREPGGDSTLAAMPV